MLVRIQHGVKAGKVHCLLEALTGCWVPMPSTSSIYLASALQVVFAEGNLDVPSSNNILPLTAN
jgi:hypothetical protein